MSLPEILDLAQKPVEVPSSLLRCSDELGKKGGLKRLQSVIEEAIRLGKAESRALEKVKRDLFNHKISG
jgi:hypothetical protein